MKGGLTELILVSFVYYGSKTENHVRVSCVHLQRIGKSVVALSHPRDSRMTAVKLCSVR